MTSVARQITLIHFEPWFPILWSVNIVLSRAKGNMDEMDLLKFASKCESAHTRPITSYGIIGKPPKWLPAFLEAEIMKVHYWL